MGYGVNHITSVGLPPMTILLNRSGKWPHLLETLLELYLNISKASNVDIYASQINEAIRRCNGKEKCTAMLRDYQNKV